MSRSKTNDPLEELVPKTKAWNDGKGIDVRDWVSCEGDFQLAVGYSTVFWPEFFEIGKYVLTGPAPAGLIRDWETRYPNEFGRIEAVLNHFHIATLRRGDDDEASEERVLHIGNVLKQIYIAKLKMNFPDREFEVVFDDTPGKDLMDYDLTFYQTRHERRKVFGFF